MLILEAILIALLVGLIVYWVAQLIPFTARYAQPLALIVAVLVLLSML
jgi:hypothetical protein